MTDCSLIGLDSSGLISFEITVLFLRSDEESTVFVLDGDCLSFVFECLILVVFSVDLRFRLDDDDDDELDECLDDEDFFDAFSSFSFVSIIMTPFIRSFLKVSSFFISSF